MRESSESFLSVLATHLAPARPSSYDIFAINIASTMIGYVYGPGGKLTSNQDLGVKVATPVGTLIGQLFFGWLADKVGRKRMCERPYRASFPSLCTKIMSDARRR